MRITTVILFLTLVAPMCRAQERLSVAHLVTLLECGFSPDEVLRVAQKDGVAIREADRTTIERLDLPEQIKAWLEAEAAKQLQPKLSLTDVLGLWRSGASEREIRDRIVSTKSSFVLNIDEVLELVRSGVPETLIKLMRGATAAERVKDSLNIAANRMTAAKVVEETSKGTAAEAIIQMIRDTDSVFEIDARDVIELSRSGVDRLVLKEMYSRRIVSAQTPESRPADTQPSPVVLADPDPGLTIYRGDANTWSMLVPARFVASKEFRGNRSIVQWTQGEQLATGDLPEIEVSVMRLLATEKDRAQMTTANLVPVATRFMEGVRQRFENDGIKMALQEPLNVWVSDRQGLLFSTSSTTSGALGYIGSSVVVMSDSSFYLVSYSCRAEHSAKWQTLLDSCLHSFAFTAGRADPIIDQNAITTDRDQLQSLFSTWKSSLYRYDYTTYRMAHASLEDSVDNRLSFVRRAEEISTKKRRLEAGKIDAEKGTIEYKVWSKDEEVTTDMLLASKTPEGWRLK